MVLVPSSTQPELTTEVVGGSAKQSRGISAAGQLHSGLQSHHPVASGAKSPAEAIRVQFPNLDGDGEQPNTVCAEAEPHPEGQNPMFISRWWLNGVVGVGTGLGLYVGSPERREGVWLST